MTTLKLKNHQIWQDLTEILENLDPNSLVQKHLQRVTEDKHFLKLQFSIMNFLENIGELVLIYNENLELVDENWLLDIDSPLLDKRQFTNT